VRRFVTGHGDCCSLSEDRKGFEDTFYVTMDASCALKWHRCWFMKCSGSEVLNFWVRSLWDF
jgi:hypothetical protein